MLLGPISKKCPDKFNKNRSKFIFPSFHTSRFRGGVTRGSRGAAAPPDFENPKKLSHKNAIKLEFFEKWGKIGLLAPPDFRSSRRP